MPVHLIALLAVVVLLCVVSIRLVRLLFKLYGAHVVECPENHRPAGVELDMRCALSTGLAASPQLSLSTCSRWPEHAGCGQGCLSQIENGPENCLVRKVLSDWYAKQKCFYCGLSFGDIQWAVRKPAVQMAGSPSVDVDSIPVEQLPDVLAKARPVCFACHVANTWVREHPDLVTDRSNRKPN